MSAPIVITVPTKYIPINLAPLAIKTEPSPSSPLSDADESTSSMDEFLVRGKKRRLDHLTWEEKLQRKKLKNRVAAQTSRDRKKAKMEDMEQTIQQQTEQISELQLKCASLQSEKDAYYSKCLDLETRQEELERRLNELQQQIQLTTTVKSEPAMAPAASHSVGSASNAKLRWRKRGTEGGGLLLWLTDRFWAAWTTELKMDEAGEDDVSRHGGLRRFSSLKMSRSAPSLWSFLRETSDSGSLPKAPSPKLAFFCDSSSRNCSWWIRCLIKLIFGIVSSFLLSCAYD